MNRVNVVAIIALLFPTIIHAAIKTTGYVDVSYNYLVRSNRFVGGSLDRFNDISPNGISLQQATATFATTPAEGFGASIMVLVGRDAYGIAPFGYNADILGIQTIGVTFPEAYIQFQTTTTRFQIGELQALAGYESIQYPSNMQFSNSILYGYAVSGVGLGARLTQALTHQLSLVFGINNGWDSIKLPGQQDNIEWAVIYNYSPSFSITVDGTIGQAHLTSNTTTGRTYMLRLFDAYATWDITQKFSIAANYDYADQTKAQLPNRPIGKATWQGIALYAKYILADKWIASARAELFEDSHGFRTGVNQYWREATLSLAYLPWKNWQIRGGTRHDLSNKLAFVNKTGGGANRHQQSYSLDVLYQFD